MFCSDYEEDDRDESESIDNVDILSSLLISPLFNQEVSLLGTLISCSLDWRKKRTFSSCARPPFQSESRCEAFDMKMIFFILMQVERERFCTWPRFESERFWNSQMACFSVHMWLGP